MNEVKAAHLSRRVSMALGAACLALAVVLPGTSQSASPVRPAVAVVDQALQHVSGTVHIIVQKFGGGGNGPEHAVSGSGGSVTRDLPLINGFSATVPARAIPTLASEPGVRVISLDRKVQVQAGGNPTTPNSVYPQVISANKMWQAGYTGGGVTVALIDTGVDGVPDLAGRVVTVTNDLTGASAPCENLSGESDCTDNYGHGTFIAGIIAGNGAMSSGQYTGVAPQANVLSIKIAGRDGSADVSNVIAALQFAVSFQSKYNIKVINLSLGTNGTQSYQTDPLNYAVEKAWSAGMVVVVSAGNLGPNPKTISKPGDDPWVITVGAVDDRGTPGDGDDQLPNFSAHGPTAADGLAKPDVVAPGAHMVSLRAPGSAVDSQFPNYVGTGYHKGSGTSMATGVVSGSVALMLQANPTMAPDRVKYALTSTARPDASTDPMAVGAGMVNAYDATYKAPPGLANLGNGHSSGLGTLDGSRGSVQVSALNNPVGTVVQGTLTVQLLLWDPILFTTGSWTASSWYASSWYASSWYASSWYGSSWYASSWYGSSWYGQPDGSSWYGSSWYGSSWYGFWE
jgi:serine protease AprX